MARYREATPIAGPEAFESAGEDAELSRAAIVLSAGAAVGSRADQVDDLAALGLPQGIRAIGRDRAFGVAEAAAPLDVDLRSHTEDRELRLPGAVSADLTRRLIDRPAAQTAAALVEANLHSESLLVRTCAAVAALETTGPRDDVLDVLVEGAGSRDQLTRDIARIGLARVAPRHPALRRAVPTPATMRARSRAAATVIGDGVITHGTFSADTTWWRPGGDLYTYLDARPEVRLNNPSFSWSGDYSDGARALAAQQLAEWTTNLGLGGVDLYAHSHGGTVAHLATRRGVRLDLLVLMSWPVHGEWFPDFAMLRTVIDIRVKMDLVILADRGGQTFDVPPAVRPKVVSHVNGWFRHSDPNQPGYWDEHGLVAVVAEATS